MTARIKDQLLSVGFLGVGLYLLYIGATKTFAFGGYHSGVWIPWWVTLLAGVTALALAWSGWPKGKR